MDGPVTTVRINRPEVRNAVDRATAEALVAAFEEFDADPDAAVAVLARQLAAFPRTCMRHDRLSTLEQEGLSEQDALAVEYVHGVVSVTTDTVAGATRFADGAGRHGSFGTD